MKADKLKATMSAFAVPAYLRDGLAMFITQGVRPGGFLFAVLSNNLHEAVVRADVQSGAALVNLVTWLISEAPERCWGTEERVRDWIAMGGHEGINERGQEP